MATENPRVAAYPPPLVYERLVELKRVRGLKSDSAAIVAILEAYLCGNTPNVLPSEPSGTSKRIEDLEVKVSSLLCDVAVLKQAMSQHTRLASGELLFPNEDMHQSDNNEHLSEPPNKSSNTNLDSTNESVVTSANTSTRELQITQTDGETKLVKSSVCETTLATSEPLGESIVVVQRSESILNYLLVKENILPNKVSRSEPLSSTSDFVETPEVLDKGLGDTHIVIDESLASFNQLLAPKQTNTSDAKEFSVELSSSSQWSEPTRVDIIQDSEESEKITSERPESDVLEIFISESPDSPLSGLSVVEENHHPKVPSVIREPLDDLPSSSLTIDESINSLKVPFHLTGAALARRLNVSPSTLRHKKNARNFGKWTSGHDPDGIAWHFDGQKFIVHTATDIQ